jgi:hypothetical protein
MKNFGEDKTGIFRYEVGIKELEEVIFLKSFKWGSTTGASFIKFIEKLEDENIKYAIEANSTFKCQNVYIEKKDKPKISLLELLSE